MKRKSILKALLLTVLMCCLTFALVACGGKHTVTFNYGVDGNGDGEVDVVTVEVGDGSLLEEPTDVPTRDGYTFVGWGTDNGMWNFEEDTVTSDLTLTARWSAGDPIDPGTPGTTVYVNYALGVGAADSASEETRQPVTPGTTIKLPDAPAANAGWEFTGWLVEKETELRAAGSDYTVTGTVTITAQWKSVAYTQYTWQVTTPPSDSAAGVATGTPVGGGKDITVELPAFPANESGYADVPTAGKYNVETADATCTENATETLYYTIPQTQTYESYTLLIDVQPLPGEPATGHLYTTWTVTQQPSASATGTATETCADCGKTIEITLPVLSDGSYASEGTDATCETAGVKTYTYTIPDEDLKDNNVSAAEGTVKTVSFTVTTPATGHDYPAEATWQENKFVVNCNNDCGENYTLTITFATGGGTGDAPDMSSMKVSFDEEAMTFSFMTPESCPFTAPERNFFDGWSDGESTYGNSAPVTVPATAEASITLTAQWTTEHTHRFTNNPHYDAATDTVVITCALCDEEKSYEVTGISLDDGAPSSFVVTDTAVGATVDLPEDFTVNARGSWETDEDSGVTTAIAIPASELTAEIATNAFKNATITVELKEGVTVNIENVTLYQETKAAGSQSNYAIESLGDFTGEFEMQFSLTNIVPSSNNWESWIIIFESNELEARLRVDNYLQYNFGRAEGQFTADNTPGASVQLSGFENNDAEFWSELKAMTAVDFTISRTYNTESGVYTIVVTVRETNGDAVAAYTIVEPETTGNRITVSLSADGANTSFTRSSTVAANENYDCTFTSIAADDVTVAYGTELNDVPVSVYGVSSRTPKDLIASGYTLTCDGYSATTPDTYTVTVKYGEFEDTVSLTVLEEENWIAVNQTIENPTAWATWYDLPVSLAFGQVISIKGSQAGANPTLMDGESIINWHTVLWQTNNGKFSGRLDNFGWTFGSTESPSAVTVGSGNTVALKNASGEVQEFDWEKVHYLMQNSDFTFTYDWTTEGVLKLTIEVTATSGDYEGWVYTNEYYMNVNADSLTNGVIDIHLTGENITSFTVDSYLVRDSQ